MADDCPQAVLPVQDADEVGTAGGRVRDLDLEEVVDIDRVDGRQRHAVCSRAVHPRKDADPATELPISTEREQLVIADVLGLRGVQRTIEGYNDLGGLMVNAEPLDFYDRRAHRHRLRLGAARASDLVVVAVAVVAGHPLVGAGRGGHEARGRAVGGVAVDRGRLRVHGGAVERQGEGDRAGRVEAARQRGRVGQLGAAAHHHGRAGGRGDGRAGRVHHHRLVAEETGGWIVEGVTTVVDHPLVSARHRARGGQREAGRRAVGGLTTDRSNSLRVHDSVVRVVQREGDNTAGVGTDQEHTGRVLQRWRPGVVQRDARRVGGRGDCRSRCLYRHRLVALGAADRVVVAVAAVAGHPLVGARLRGLGPGRRAVGGVAVVDRDHLRVNHSVARVVQREGDRAGRVEAARQRGRVLQGKHAELVFLLRGGRGDGRAGRAHHHRLAAGRAADRVVVAIAVVGGDPVVGPRRGRGVAGGGGHAVDQRHVGEGDQRRAARGRVVVEVEGDGAGRAEPAADGRLVGDRAADGGAGRLLAGVDRRGGRGDRHRLGGGGAADRVVVAIAVVGGDPVVGPRRGRGVAGGGGHAVDQRHVGEGDQRRAARGRVVVEVEGDGAGRAEPAADGRLVGDRAADGGAGRLLGGVDRRAGRGDRHRLGGGGAADRVVVAIAVVGGDPVVGPRCRRRVAGGGGHAVDQRHVGEGDQRRAARGRVVVEVEGDGAGRAEPAADGRLVGDRAADGGGGRLLAGVDRRGGRGDRHRLGGGGAADRVVVAIAVVGGDPVVGPRR